MGKRGRRHGRKTNFSANEKGNIKKSTPATSSKSNMSANAENNDYVCCSTFIPTDYWMFNLIDDEEKDTNSQSDTKEVCAYKLMDYGKHNENCANTIEKPKFNCTATTAVPSDHNHQMMDRTLLEINIFRNLIQCLQYKHFTKTTEEVGKMALQQWPFQWTRNPRYVANNVSLDEIRQYATLSQFNPSYHKYKEHFGTDTLNEVYKIIEQIKNESFPKRWGPPKIATNPLVWEELPPKTQCCLVIKLNPPDDHGVTTAVSPSGLWSVSQRLEDVRLSPFPVKPALPIIPIGGLPVIAGKGSQTLLAEKKENCNKNVTFAYTSEQSVKVEREPYVCVCCSTDIIPPQYHVLSFHKDIALKDLLFPNTCPLECFCSAVERGKHIENCANEIKQLKFHCCQWGSLVDWNKQRMDRILLEICLFRNLIQCLQFKNFTKTTEEVGKMAYQQWPFQWTRNPRYVAHNVNLEKVRRYATDVESNPKYQQIKEHFGTRALDVVKENIELFKTETFAERWGPPKFATKQLAWEELPPKTQCCLVMKLNPSKSRSDGISTNFEEDESIKMEIEMDFMRSLLKFIEIDQSWKKNENPQSCNKNGGVDSKPIPQDSAGILLNSAGGTARKSTSKMPASFSTETKGNCKKNLTSASASEQNVKEERAPDDRFFISCDDVIPPEYRMLRFHKGIALKDLLFPSIGRVQFFCAKIERGKHTENCANKIKRLKFHCCQWGSLVDYNNRRMDRILLEIYLFRNLIQCLQFKNFTKTTEEVGKMAYQQWPFQWTRNPRYVAHNVNLEKVRRYATDVQSNPECQSFKEHFGKLSLDVVKENIELFKTATFAERWGSPTFATKQLAWEELPPKSQCCLVMQLNPSKSRSDGISTNEEEDEIVEMEILTSIVESLEDLKLCQSLGKIENPQSSNKNGGVDSKPITQDSAGILLNSAGGTARKSASKMPASFSAKRSRCENDSNMNIEQKICLVSRPKATNAKVDFKPHQCSKKCVADFPYKTGDSKNENPMAIPMLWGWQREVTNKRKVRRPIVSYVTPCGRQFLNIDEVYQYLCVTRSQLGVDLFCFDSHVDCLNEFEPVHVLTSIKDISKGNENIRLSSVNSIERRDPVFVDYCTERIPRKGVDLNLDPDFLVCCDCTDDCQNKEKCQCWQLTIQATAMKPGGKINRDAGYEYRRLSKNVVTGIYECNKRCKCRNTCLNRVAQWPLQMRLQLFKTESCGWGVRCLDDIPQGQFICVYVGELLNGQEADAIGKKFGDQYFADVDLIETIEKAKEGYESDVDNTSCSSITEDECEEISDYSCELNNTARSRIAGIRSFCEKMSAVSLYPTKTKSTSGEKSPSTLELFGNDNCFVMDAKNIGNIGRYLNHSCSPNIFVQNVFVDSHDLRFPWIAFFSKNHIRAGTELAWDYQYTVGSVPGKKIICHCGAKECRGRLL